MSYEMLRMVMIGFAKRIMLRQSHKKENISDMHPEASMLLGCILFSLSFSFFFLQRRPYNDIITSDKKKRETRNEFIKGTVYSGEA